MVYFIYHITCKYVEKTCLRKTSIICNLLRNVQIDVIIPIKPDDHTLKCSIGVKRQSHRNPHVVIETPLHYVSKSSALWLY